MIIQSRQIVQRTASPNAMFVTIFNPYICQFVTKNLVNPNSAATCTYI